MYKQPLILFIFLVFFFNISLCLSGAEPSVQEIKSREFLNNATNPDYEITLILVYEDDSSEKDILQKVIGLSRKIEGFANFYSLKCADFKDFKYCSSTEPKPLVAIYRPPEYKVNPYTGKQMEIMTFSYDFNMLKNATSEQLVNIFIAALPDYSNKFEPDTIAQLQVLKYLNKVMLFTARNEAPPLFKALSARYKNRLIFGVISNKEEQIAKDYNVKQFPQIIVEQSIDHETGQVFSPPKIHYYNGEVKINQIENFIKPYATNHRLSEAEMNRIFHYE